MFFEFELVYKLENSSFAQAAQPTPQERPSRFISRSKGTSPPYPIRELKELQGWVWPTVLDDVRESVIERSLASRQEACE